MKNVALVVLPLAVIFAVGFFFFAELSSPLMAEGSTEKSENEKGVKLNPQFTFNVSGMTCSGCQAGLKQSLEKVKGVKSANVSYKNGSAAIFCDPKECSKEDLTKAVEKAGYKVVQEPKEDLQKPLKKES